MVTPLELEHEELLWRVLGELKRRRDALLEMHRAQAWAELERLLWAQHVRRQAWRAREVASWQHRRRRWARQRRRWARAAARKEARRKAEARAKARAEAAAKRAGRAYNGACGVDEHGVSYCGCGGDYLLEPLEVATTDLRSAA